MRKDRVSSSCRRCLGGLFALVLAASPLLGLPALAQGAVPPDAGNETATEARDGAGPPSDPGSGHGRDDAPGQNRDETSPGGQGSGGQEGGTIPDLPGQSAAQADPQSAQAATESGAARDAVRSGRALPLDSILEAARSIANGEVIDARLVPRAANLTYEIRMLQTDGLVRTLVFDARTGRHIGGR